MKSQIFSTQQCQDLLPSPVPVVTAPAWVSVAVAWVSPSVVSIPRVGLGISFGGSSRGSLSISRSLAEPVATIVGPGGVAVIGVSVASVVSIPGVGLGISSGGSLSISRPLANVVRVSVIINMLVQVNLTESAIQTGLGILKQPLTFFDCFW